MKYLSCQSCQKEIIGNPVKSEPVRCFASPNSINHNLKKDECFYLNFCSKECEQKDQKTRYTALALLDRNASDSECFEAKAVKKDRLGRTIRIGKCKITGQEVQVEPLMFGTNSGQPKECYEHFKLRHNYKPYLANLSNFWIELTKFR